jgi:putative ABC transport system substrate-binding protein
VPFDDARTGADRYDCGSCQSCKPHYPYADNLYDRLPALAAELVSKRVTAIYASGGNRVVSVAKAATSTIPIVFSTGGDPVGAGVVESFNRPGGNVTGVSFVNNLATARAIGLDVPPTLRAIADAVIE